MTNKDENIFFKTTNSHVNFNDLNINRGRRSGIKNDFEFNQDDNMYMGYKPRNYF